MNPFFTYKKVIVLLCLTVLDYAAIAQEKKETKVEFPKAADFNNAKLNYKIIPGEHNGFGYDIYSNGRLTIHQATIPAVAGNNGFKTKDKAERVAKLVIEKIKKGEMPPTLSIEEMKKLKAI
jgi:hypothetical protein